MPGAVTIRVRSGSSPLRERPAVEDILGQFGKSGHELGIRHYERICPDFVKVMIFFVYGRNICIILEMQTEVLQGGMA